MDRDTIRAYLWQDIIRLGFSPKGTKDQKVWLVQYARSLSAFWEVDYTPLKLRQERTGIKGSIDTSITLGLIYDYTFKAFDKFDVTFMYSPPIEDREFMWQHDMDSAFFYFPNITFSDQRKQRKIALREMEPSDIEAVIDALIVHPMPHQHIESPLNKHEIRIGGGIGNFFLYLFHLRVQLCPDKTRRKAEKDRLLSLFDPAVKADRSVPPGELMRIP